MGFQHYKDETSYKKIHFMNANNFKLLLLWNEIKSLLKFVSSPKEVISIQRQRRDYYPAPNRGSRHPSLCSNVPGYVTPWKSTSQQNMLPSSNVWRLWSIENAIAVSKQLHEERNTAVSLFALPLLLSQILPCAIDWEGRVENKGLSTGINQITQTTSKYSLYCKVPTKAENELDILAKMTLRNNTVDPSSFVSFVSGCKARCQTREPRYRRYSQVLLGVRAEL